MLNQDSGGYYMAPTIFSDVKAGDDADADAGAGRGVWASVTVPLGGVKQSGNGVDKYTDFKTAAWIQL